MHSEATRIRSAFMPERMQRKPLPASPIRFAAGTRISSKNTSVVAWFIMVRIGRMVRLPLPASRMSTSRTESPSVLFVHLVARRGAAEQQHEVGVLGSRGPDLLAVDPVVVAIEARGGPQGRGIGAAGRLGHPEGLEPQAAVGDAGKVGLLLLRPSRAAGWCPWCTSARGRRRRCRRSGGSPRGSPRRPRSAARSRRTRPGSRHAR